MNKLLKHIENTFAAVAFAEAGEHDVAMEIAGIQPERKDWVSAIGKILEKTFLAVTFAEANCHEIAMGYIDKRRISLKDTSFTSFLENVGLANVRVCYVMAKV